MHISLMLLAEQIVALELLQGDALDFSLENWSSYFEVANLRCQKIGSYHISHVPNMEKLIQSSLMASLRDGNDLESHLGSPSNSSDSSIDSCSYSCKCVNGFEFGKTWKKKLRSLKILTQQSHNQSCFAFWFFFDVSSMFPAELGPFKGAPANDNPLARDFSQLPMEDLVVSTDSFRSATLASRLSILTYLNIS